LQSDQGKAKQILHHIKQDDISETTTLTPDRTRWETRRPDG